MWNKKDFKIAVLYSVILFFISIFLLSACFRLFFSIVHTFIYLSGLITVLIITLLFISIIGLIVRYILKALLHHKRTYISKLDILNKIISIEIHTIQGLLVLLSMLYALNMFIN